MSNFVGPTGKQIPNHSLELDDLPYAVGGEGQLIISNAGNIFVEVSGDTFIQSKMSTGDEATRVWSAQYLTQVVGNIEAALDAILGV
jgi:hypothetical protein